MSIIINPRRVIIIFLEKIYNLTVNYKKISPNYESKYK